MDIETFNRREKMLKLREELLAVEEDRMNGSQGYSVSEVVQMMNNVIDEANREIYEHSEKLKRLNDILDHTELRFKSYRAEVEYEEQLEGRDVDEIGYGEDFATYVQYLVSKGCNISEAVHDTYKLFESIGATDDGDSQIIQFVCQYCLYGDEIVKSYFDILMQMFNDELNNL